MPSYNALPTGLTATTPTVLQFIELAYRDAGLSAEATTPQYLNAGRQVLQQILQNLSNLGTSLWLLEYQLIGSRAGQRQYTLPVGTVEVKEANYRYPINPLPTTPLPTDNLTSPNAFDKTLTGPAAVGTNVENWFGAYYAGGLRVLHVGVNAYAPTGSATYTLNLEYSSDGNSWTTLLSFPAVTLADSEWNYWQIDGSPTANYWRVSQNIANGVLSIRQLVLGNVQQDITMARLNRDDYFNLPNKDFTSIRALQYWYDRQTTPVINLWPVPQDDFQMYQFLLYFQMPDVGKLGDQLYIPKRWISAVQKALSHRLALQLPNIDLQRIQYLDQQAQTAYRIASNEERDNAPIYARPTIRPYTR